MPNGEESKHGGAGALSCQVCSSMGGETRCVISARFIAELCRESKDKLQFSWICSKISIKKVFKLNITVFFRKLEEPTHNLDAIE